MSYSKSGYSTSGEGYLHVPEELVLPYLDAKQLADFRETIQPIKSEKQWVNEYERSILGIEDSSGGLCRLIEAKATFSRFATREPLARIPVAAILRANNVTHGFIMRIDPKGEGQSRMRILVDNSLKPHDKKG